MALRLGALWYWLGIAAAILLVAVAVVWNVWTIQQFAVAQRQLDVVDASVAAPPTTAPAPGSPAASELELLLDADRRGILEDNFVALLTEPQKRALAEVRRQRLDARAGSRTVSLVAGVGLLIAAAGIFRLVRRGRRRAIG